MAGMSRAPGAIPPPHPAGGVASGVGPNQGSGPPPGYVGNQQQAAMMKQMMAMEEKRVQMHMLEQQKLFREQRQQQQLLAEQVPEHERAVTPGWFWSCAGLRGDRGGGRCRRPVRAAYRWCECTLGFHISARARVSSDALLSRLLL